MDTLGPKLEHESQCPMRETEAGARKDEKSHQELCLALTALGVELRTQLRGLPQELLQSGQGVRLIICISNEFPGVMINIDC